MVDFLGGWGKTSQIQSNGHLIISPAKDKMKGMKETLWWYQEVTVVEEEQIPDLPSRGEMQLINSAKTLGRGWGGSRIWAPGQQLAFGALDVDEEREKEPREMTSTAAMIVPDKVGCLLPDGEDQNILISSGFPFPHTGGSHESLLLTNPF